MVKNVEEQELTAGTNLLQTVGLWLASYQNLTKNNNFSLSVL